MNRKDNPKFFTVKETQKEQGMLRTGEVAKILKIHPNTVRGLVDKGLLIPTRHNSLKGGHYRFYEDDVLRLLAIQVNEKYAETNQNEYKRIMDIIEESDIINSLHDIHVFMDKNNLGEQERIIVELVVNAMNPYIIFGKYMERLEERVYSRHLIGQDETWVTETIRATTPNGQFNTVEGRSVINLLESIVKVGYGRVNGQWKLFLVLSLIESEKTFIFDGTMQQMYPLMKKGVLKLEEKHAKDMFGEYYTLDIWEYLEIFLQMKSQTEKKQQLNKKFNIIE